jgi:hypothetical protein
MKTHLLTLLLPGALAIGLQAVQAQTQTAVPQVTTTDGRIYRNVTVLRSDPDGLLINYEAEQPGVALAKIKFRNLPDSLRKQYNYEEQKATEFETQQAQANAQWRTQSETESPFQRYRAFAELNRSLAGDGYISYSLSMDANGKLTAQGFTGNVLPFPNYGVWSFPYLPAFSLGGASDSTKPGPAKQGN